MNQSISTALSSIAIAQILKIPTTYLMERQIQVEKVLHTGGMPSSHSAGVASLATHVGLEKGWDSTDFAVATLLGIIVMFDAFGIRRHAGTIAVQVNDLDADVERLAGEHPGIYHKKRAEKLKENLGHQPVEVVAGAVLGVGIAVASYLLSKK